jgi:hypothetical protein
MTTRRLPTKTDYLPFHIPSNTPPRDSAISSAGAGRKRLGASPATAGDQLSRMQWTQPIHEDICADRRRRWPQHHPPHGESSPWDIPPGLGEARHGWRRIPPPIRHQWVLLLPDTGQDGGVRKGQVRRERARAEEYPTSSARGRCVERLPNRNPTKPVRHEFGELVLWIPRLEESS